MTWTVSEYQDQPLWKLGVVVVVNPKDVIYNEHRRKFSDTNHFVGVAIAKDVTDELLTDLIRRRK